jgi:hypothetical protein
MIPEGAMEMIDVHVSIVLLANMHFLMHAYPPPKHVNPTAYIPLR